MKHFLTCLVFVLLTITGYGQEKLTKLKIDKELEVRIPASFTPLTPQEILSKYLTNSTPVTVYGDERRTSEFSITRIPTRWTSKDAEILIDFYKASILSAYTEVVFSQEKLVEVNDQQFILFEFRSFFKEENNNSLTQSRSVSKYTYLMYGLRNGNMYVFNFSAPAKEQQYWQDTVNKMMQSIKFL